MRQVSPWSPSTLGVRERSPGRAHPSTFIAVLRAKDRTADDAVSACGVAAGSGSGPLMRSCG